MTSHQAAQNPNNFSSWYDQILHYGNAIMTTYQNVSDPNNPPKVKGEDINVLVDSVLNPLFRAQALGVCVVAGCYFAGRFTAKIPIVSWFSGVFSTLMIATAFFTYECHQVYSGFNDKLGDFSLRHWDEGVTWNVLKKEISLSAHTIRRNTFLLGHDQIFGSDLRQLSSALDAFQSKKVNKVDLNGWLIPILKITRLTANGMSAIQDIFNKTSKFVRTLLDSGTQN